MSNIYYPTTENINNNKQIKFRPLKKNKNKLYNIIIFILSIGCLYSILISTYLLIIHVNFMSTINLFFKHDVIKNNTIDFINSIYKSNIVKHFINNTINLSNNIANDLDEIN